MRRSSRSASLLQISNKMFSGASSCAAGKQGRRTTSIGFCIRPQKLARYINLAYLTSNSTSHCFLKALYAALKEAGAIAEFC
jgi:hypothetical protein